MPHTWLTGQNVNLPGQCGSGLSAVVNLSKAIYQILVFVCSPRIGDAAKYVGCRSLGAQGRRPEGAAATAEMVEAALRGCRARQGTRVVGRSGKLLRETRFR